MTRGLIAAVVRLCVRYAWATVLAAIIGGAIAADYDVRHFGLDSQTENLVSPNAAWRVQERHHDAAFPQLNDLIVVVVDSASPERDEEAAAKLAARLANDKQLFVSVSRPDGDPYFAKEGILLLPAADVRSTMAQLIKAQPFLGALAADPSLRGLLSSLSTALQGVRHGQATLKDLSAPLSALTTVLQDVEANRPAFLSWRAMLTGAKPGTHETRRFILVKPRLDYSQLTPGTRASDAIRAAAIALGLTPQNGVRVRLTGSVQMSDEEFATLGQNAALLGTIVLAGMILMLWLAVRSFRIIGAILVTLFIGLALTMAGAFTTIGSLNVISIGFIPLFVGLGVDFGIQFSVRYRAERHKGTDLGEAIARAGGSIGNALALAAAAIAAGFYSFAPTDYVGLAELGLIAGSGMLVTFVLSLTCLPAMLALLKPGAETAEIGWQWLKPLDNFVALRARNILTAAIVLAIVSLASLVWLRFDFNPLDLRSPKTESVATALDLMKDLDTSPNAIDVIVPNHAAAVALAAKLGRLPEVGSVLSIDTFVPQNQNEKLAALADASFLLDPTINPIMTAPPPSDADLVSSLLGTAKALRDAASSSASEQSKTAKQFADVLQTLAKGTPALRARASAALVPGMQTMLTQIRAVLQARKVTFADLPPDVVRDWVTASGFYRLEIAPSGDASSNAALAKFTRAVRAVAPNATGAPIAIQESGKTIVNAFIEAGILSFIAITLLLALWLRNIRDVIFALVPLIFAFVFTLATSVAVGMPLNFANIIALPLLFGIGVAFDVYFVVAWRSGVRQLLHSPLGRAVILSAGTTAFGFGTLAFSSHPGTASMGILLLISLAWILTVVLVLLPALMTAFSARR